jgi:hypothetical protein
MANPATDRFLARPPTLAALKEYVLDKEFKPPDGPFDPRVSWRHMYRLWMVGREVGYLQLTRTAPADGGPAQLEVDQRFMQENGVAVTTAAIRTGTDPLACPQSWDLEAVILDTDAKPVEVTRIKAAGAVKDGAVHATRGGRTTARPAPAPLTSNWSLFDAVQRLAPGDGKTLEFTLLEELDLLKPEQQLAYRGTVATELGGRAVTLHHWQHLGRGIEPYDYYVDGSGRLLVALSGIRAYFLDPGAPALYQEQLQFIQRRAPRLQ